MLFMSEMSEIYQVHLRAVMLFMSEMSEIIINLQYVEIHSIEYCTKDQSNVEDVEDRSNTPKGCNAMYVKGVEDGKEHTHTFWLITSLILNGFSIQKKF